MKKAKKPIIVIIIIVAVYIFFNNPKVQTKLYANVNAFYCKTVSKKDTHVRDGETIIVFDCSKNKKKMAKQVKKWKRLPLTENLQLIMYGGERDGITYSFKLANKNGIPNIKNGYYRFINRNSDASSKEDDDIFDKYSFNIILVLYDSDTSKMYYYKFDT